VQGSLRFVESDVLEMDDGDVIVPIGTVHACAIRHELLDHCDELGRDPE